MSDRSTDKVFAGSVPKLYESHLVPLIFKSYAADLARRVALRPVSRVLEVAAGTGVVTRDLAAVLPANVAIVATDLNQPMLDLAAEIGTQRPVVWQQADAQQLPFVGGCSVPVGSHVLSREIEGFRGSPSCSQSRRRVNIQRLGPHRGQRFRPHRNQGPRIDLSAGSAALPGAHASRLLRSRGRRTRFAPWWFSGQADCRHGVGAQSGGVSPWPGDRLLPGNPVAQ